jgi:CHAT domain-containing protein
MRFILSAFVIAALVFANVAAKADDARWQRLFAEGVASRAQGGTEQSVQLLEEAVRSAPGARERMLATGELGASLLRLRRLDQAAAALSEAHRFFSGSERARYAIDLGNLAQIAKRPEEAQRYYQEASQLAEGDARIALSAALNLARLAPAAERGAALSALYPRIEALDEASLKARLLLNLGTQARGLGGGGLELAHRSATQARALAASAGDRRLEVEALDALAQLYEDQQRTAEAAALTLHALEAADKLAEGQIGDARVNLHWRQARLFTLAGRDAQALAAYQRTVDQVERIRQDIPIDYEDGSSSFRRTLEPVYLGLFDALLRASDTHAGEARTNYLRRARDALELIKQAELQDYLGDRCTVDTVKGGTPTVIPPATAVLYAVILGDRIELLVETATELRRHTTRVPGAAVRRAAATFANELREGQPGFLARARELYDWLIRPLEGFIAERGVKTLVVVPDGALRLVALAALHDGERFLVEKLALGTVTGLSMTYTGEPTKRAERFLIAGISEPGPVVDKLSDATVAHLLGTDSAQKIEVAGVSQGRALRSLRLGAIVAAGGARERSGELRKALALPGVQQEVEAIGRIARSKTLLNAPFTVEGFRREAETGAYRFVHVASHGVFGGAAGSSYVLAYDDLLTLDGLQSLLKADEFRKNPIELLSLSACETAEGDERSPLGISGAAMKARAKSVLGTLWPVDDVAARRTMEQFYQGLLGARLTKAEALRRSQLELLRSEEFGHPFFWAPFTLIGNWL